MQNLGNILSIDNNTTSIGILIEILNAISVTFLIARNGNLIISNGCNRPIGVSGLLIPANHCPIKCNSVISKSNNATSANNFTSSGRFINRQATHIDINTKVGCNILKFKHCISQSNGKVAVMEILAKQCITSATTNFLVGNAEIKCRLCESFSIIFTWIRYSPCRLYSTIYKLLMFSHEIRLYVLFKYSYQQMSNCDYP